MAREAGDRTMYSIPLLKKKKKKAKKSRDLRSAFQQLLRPWSGEILERQHHNPSRTSSQQLFWLAANFCRLSKLKWEGWVHTDYIELQLHLFSKSNNAGKCISNHCCGSDWLSPNGSAETWKSNKVTVSKTPTLWVDLWMRWIILMMSSLSHLGYTSPPCWCVTSS